MLSRYFINYKSAQGLACLKNATFKLNSIRASQNFTQAIDMVSDAKVPSADRKLPKAQSFMEASPASFNTLEKKDDRPSASLIDTALDKCKVSIAVPTTMVWKDVPKLEISGAILPFSQLNFLQVLLLPHTYAVMYYMTFLLDFMPWWMAIVGTTMTIRLALFPFFVKQNIIGVKSNNIMPQSQMLQSKMNEAYLDSDTHRQIQYKTQWDNLQKEHGTGVWERVKPMLIQVPMYMSMFFLLRKLSMLPVDSMLTGGALWFSNLTLPDPYYILPTLTCTSTLLLIEFGSEGASGPLKLMGPMGRWGFRLVPVVIFAFIRDFPAAILLFWCTNNFFTLFYSLLLKNSYIRKKLNIPTTIKHDPASLPLANQSFMDQWRKAKEKSLVSKTTFENRRLDDIQFRKAGVGPLRKTHKELPR